MERTNGAYAILMIAPYVQDGPYVDGIDDVITRCKTRDYLKKTIFRIKRAIFHPTEPKVGYGEYRTSLQTCIWRVSVLKKLLVSGESAWDFELIGTKRTEQIAEPFYALTKTPVFQYFQAVSKRKYHKAAIEEINRLGFKFVPTAMPIME